MPDSTSAYVWTPTPEHLAEANVMRLARRHGVDGIEELRARSVADVSWYWNAVVEDLGLPFRTPYREVLDVSRGIAEPDWFVGGELNVADACLGRWAADPQARSRPAVVHETEDGTITALTYSELDEQVARVTRALRDLGLTRGDAVALYLPMAPEAVVAFYALARLGAVIVPLFSGFAAGAIASRLADADAKAVVVGGHTVRRGRSVSMTPQVREALRSSPSVQHLVIVGGGPEEAGDVAWADLLAAEPDTEPVEWMAAHDILLLAYTSGTTGRPKGAVHTHAGFLVKTASEVAYSFDLRPDGVFCWISDMGWITGPLSIVEAHAAGAALVPYEGSPGVPGLDRLWRLPSGTGW